MSGKVWLSSWHDEFMMCIFNIHVLSTKRVQSSRLAAGRGGERYNNE